MHYYPDIYFDIHYGKLYEDIENGKIEKFVFENELGRIEHMFIKRKIPIKIDNSIWFDLITPYGYGGPIIKQYPEKKSMNSFLTQFINSFNEYCKKNNIVSEFVRFHPIIKNHIDFSTHYETLYIRDTVGTNLKDFNDPIKSEFSKSCKKNIRKAINNGLSYKVIKNPSNLDNFKKIYFSTMNRNNAEDYYYFTDNYFKKCLTYFRQNLILVQVLFEDMIIGMGLYFYYKDIIHIHLSGTMTEYLSLNPAYMLKYAITQWAIDNGFHLIHHGGGRTNDPNDGLYLFKKQFGKNTSFKFFIGKKIYNHDIYNKLSNINNNNNTNFFPAYRS